MVEIKITLTDETLAALTALVETGEKLIMAIDDLTHALTFGRKNVPVVSQDSEDPETTEQESVEPEEPQDLQTEQVEIEKNKVQKAKPAAAAKADAKPAKTETLEVPDVEELRLFLGDCKKAGHRDEVIGILGDYGVTQLSNLDKKYYAEVYARAKALIGQ